MAPPAILTSVETPTKVARPQIWHNVVSLQDIPASAGIKRQGGAKI